MPDATGVYGSSNGIGACPAVLGPLGRAGPTSTPSRLKWWAVGCHGLYSTRAASRVSRTGSEYGTAWHPGPALPSSARSAGQARPYQERPCAS